MQLHLRLQRTARQPGKHIKPPYLEEQVGQQHESVSIFGLVVNYTQLFSQHLSCLLMELIPACSCGICMCLCSQQSKDP